MTAADWVVLADYEELGPLFGNAILAAWALVVFVALLFRAFRSWIGLFIGWIVASAASLPAVLAYQRISQWPHVANRSSVTDLWRTTILLLCFVYAAPIIQFAICRLRKRRANEQGT